MLKKFSFFIVLFHLVFIINLASADIIPLKKPLQTKKEEQKKLLSDTLVPVPKPIKETTTKVTSEIEEKQKEKFTGLILPKKKPLIAGSKDTPNIKISKYYNKKDFNLAKKAISEMKKAKWPSALKIAKKAKDKSLYNFVQWRHLLKKGNQASFLSIKIL